MIQKKICMVGSFAVGKTSLVSRFVTSLFSERYLTTVGVKIDKKVLALDGGEMTLLLWDLAGEDNVTALQPPYLRGTAGYLLVADGTRRATVDKALELRQRVAQSVGQVPHALLLNKHDLQAEWDVDGAALDRLRALGLAVHLTSARTGAGVEEAFVLLARRLREGR